MKAIFLSLSMLALLPIDVAMAKSEAIDCPSRDQPYSIDSPLLDILLSPAARAAVNGVNSALLSSLPPMFSGLEPPTFSAILSVRTLVGFSPKTSQGELDAFDNSLKKVDVTDADKIARCARYDVEAPRFEQPKGKPRVLLFEKINGYRDDPSVTAANAMFTEMAARKGWSLVVTDKGGAINPGTLKKFDAVIWNNISGDVLTLTQRQALQNYMEHGGGFVGIHGSGGDPAYFWDWYADQLIGARFLGHPMGPQFQDARVNIESTLSGIGQSLAPGWTMNEEWYSFKASPRISGAHIIATLDEKTYKPVMGKQDLRMGDDHPIVWTRCVNNGRAFYSAIGHRPESYTDSIHIRLIEDAVVWASGAGESHCKNGREIE